VEVPTLLNDICAPIISQVKIKVKSRVYSKDIWGFYVP